ncbi:MAG: hypothetical protein U9P42_09415, partial [Candidatus Fermentibacteria bacterium]|nr:hypothetical protein [Candidatus Fermentibacteria bacterium]
LKVGDLRVASNCLDKLSRIVCERSPAEALGLARESLRLARESGVVSRIVHSGIGLSRILVSNNQVQEALLQIELSELKVVGVDNLLLAEQLAEAREFVESKLLLNEL